MLDEVIRVVSGYVSSSTLIAIGVTSLALFVGTLLAIPVILVRLPPNYFDERYPRSWMRNHHPVLRLIAHLVKNVLGAIFLLAGVAMLVLPGQGILTILIGVTLLDFPGKRRLEARLIGHPPVLRAINGLRQRFGRPPLTVAPRTDKQDLTGEALDVKGER